MKRTLLICAFSLFYVGGVYAITTKLDGKIVAPKWHCAKYDFDAADDVERDAFISKVNTSSNPLTTDDFETVAPVDEVIESVDSSGTVSVDADVFKLIQDLTARVEKLENSK